jgi:hypothetical protein
MVMRSARNCGTHAECGTQPDADAFLYPRMTQTDIELAAHEVTVQMRTNEGIREIHDRYFRSPGAGVSNPDLYSETA